MRVSTTTGHAAPPDYATLYQDYYQYVAGIARRCGISPDRVEDVASDILVRLLERDVLSMFDPTKVFRYGGREHPAKFRSFLTKIVLLYLRGHRDRQDRIADREKFLCDQLVGSGDNHLDLWVEVFGPTDAPADAQPIEDLTEQHLVDTIRGHLATVPRRSRFDNCDLVELFDAVVDQVRATGAINAGALCQRFSCGATTMHTWMWWLKTNVAHALGRPAPVKRNRGPRDQTDQP